MARLSKAEKRIARKALKEARRKKVRQAVEPDALAAVRRTETPRAKKEVRVEADPADIKFRQMRWDESTSDRKGQWSWGVERNWGDEIWRRDIRPKLSNFATMTWAEIERARVKSGKKGQKSRAAHHEMAISVICSEARSRAVEIALPADTLFRFRLGSKKRLWGYRIGAVFNLIWYDPTHEIYPVEPN